MRMRHGCHTLRVPALGLVLAGLLLASLGLAGDDAGNTGAVPATFKGHTDVINAIAFSPDGKQVLTGSFDTSLKLWDAATGQEIHSFAGPAGHQKLVLSAAISPDGQTIASGSADGNAKLWDVPLTQPLRTLTHADAVNAVAVSADGKTLAGAGKDGTIRLWNSADGKELRTLRGHDGAVMSVSFHNNNQLLASGGHDGTVRVWNVADGKLLGMVYAHAGPVATVAFHPNGSWILSTGEDGALKIWQWPFTPRRPLPGQTDSMIALAPWSEGGRFATIGGRGTIQIRNSNGDLLRSLDSKELALRCTAGADGLLMAGTADGHVLIWNADNGQQLERILAHDDAVTAVAVEPQRRGLLTGSQDGLLKFWAVPSNQPEHPLTHPAAVLTALLMPDGRHLLTGSADKLVRLWELDSGRLERTFAGHNAPVTAVAVASDGRIISGSANGTIRFWDQNNGQPLGSHKAHTRAVTALAPLPDGQLLSASEDGTIVLWKVVTTARPFKLTAVWRVSVNAPVRQLVYEPVSRNLYSAGDDKKITLRALHDGKEIASFQAHDGAVTALALDATHHELLSAGADRTAKRWHLPTPSGPQASYKPTLIYHLAGPASAMALASDGSRLAVAVVVPKSAQAQADRPLVQIFDKASDQPLMALDRHKGPIHALAFRDQRLVSASADGTAHLSELGIVRVWKAHAGGVTALAVVGSSMQAVSGGGDRTVKLWDINTGKVRRTYGTLQGPIRTVAVSRDGNVLGAAADKVITLWETHNGKRLRELTLPSTVESLAFSPDRTRLLTGSADGFARVWEVATGQLLQSFRHDGASRGVVFGNDNRSVISGSEKLLAFDTLAEVRTIQASAQPVRALALVSYGSHALAGGDARGVALWNLGNGNRDRSIAGLTGQLRAAAASRNNVLLALAGEDNLVQLHAANDGRLITSLPTPAAVRDLAFAPDSQSLAVACADGSLITWDVRYNPGQAPSAEFGKPIQTYHQAAAFTGVVYAPDGRTLYSSGQDKTIRAWKVASGQPRNLGHGREVDAVAFNSKGTLLATGSHDGLVRLWDVARGNLVRQIQAHTKPMPFSVYCVAWSPDDTLLVSGSLDTSLKLWNAQTGALVRTLEGYKAKTSEKGHREGVFAVAFSPDGKQLASGGSDRTLRIWNVADGKVVHELVNPKLKPSGFPPYAPAHPGWVFGVRYTPDGKHLVSVGNGPAGTGYLAVWDAATGKLQSGQQLPLGPIYSVAISPDGKRLALGCGPRPPAQEVNGYILRMPTGVYVSRP